MLAKKSIPWILLLALFILPACTYEDLFLPKIDKKEATKNILAYLENKYHKEFTVTEIKRTCGGLGVECSHQVDAIVFAKDTPEIKFKVTYDMETKKSEDNYHAAFWSKQVQEEWNTVVEQSFHVNPNMRYLEVSVDKNLLRPDSFPYYREVLGSMITSVYISVDVPQCGGKEYWRKEAQKLVELKKSLSEKGISNSQMHLFEVVVGEVRKDGWSLCYSITMDSVSDVETTRKVLKERNLINFPIPTN